MFGYLLRRTFMQRWTAFDEECHSFIKKLTGKGPPLRELRHGSGQADINVRQLRPNASSKPIRLPRALVEQDEATSDFVFAAIVPRIPEILPRLAIILGKDEKMPSFFRVTEPLPGLYGREMAIIMELPNMDQEKSEKLVKAIQKLVDVNDDDVGIRYDRQGADMFICARLGYRDGKAQATSIPRVVSPPENATSNYILEIMAPDRSDIFACVATVLAKRTVTPDYFEIHTVGIDESVIYAELPLKPHDSEMLPAILGQRLIGVQNISLRRSTLSVNAAA